MAVDADALSRRAASLYRASRFEVALQAYREVLAIDPDRPDDWVNLGLLSRQAGLAHDALAAYDRALEAGVCNPEEVHLNRAVVLSDDLLDAPAARASLESAFAINPEFVPALLNLGNLFEDEGDRKAAKAAYAKALALQPGNILALTRVAEVTRFSDPNDPLIARLSAAVSRHGLTPIERADVGFALGRALDQAKKFDLAFSAYAEANEASRVLARNAYDPLAASSFVDALIEEFDSTVQTEAGDCHDSPIFICGMFRSGSTLAERIISSHSRVSAGGELPILPQLVRNRLQPYPTSLTDCPEAFYAELRSQYRDEIEVMGLGGRQLTDKRPDNFLHVGLIKRMFPNAKVVLTRRNPFDNCLSVFFAHLAPELTYASSLDSVAHWYGQYERLAAHWQSTFPHDVYVMDYDRLVTEPREEIERLLGYLRLEWEDACLNPHRGEGQVRTASAWQVREPLYTGSSGRWRNYRDHIDPLVDAFGPPEDA